jgi:hypothetical protein
VWTLGHLDIQICGVAILKLAVLGRSSYHVSGLLTHDVVDIDPSASQARTFKITVISQLTAATVCAALQVD